MLGHTAFVLMSYGAALAVLGVVIAWLLVDRAATKRELDRLDEAGFKRRSESADETLR